MHFQRITGLFLLVFSGLCCTSAWALEPPALSLIAGESPLWPAELSEPLLSMAPEILATVPAQSAGSGTRSHLRKLLADFAVTFRDVRYRLGGRDPSTGFDCSGFVRYVFRHSLGQDLPSTSASQFRAGEKVDRANMKTGDLVFFRTHGRQVSHVGIYLDEGRFIHSPSAGKRVSINHLSETYWAKRFVGAKRPDGLT